MTDKLERAQVTIEELRTRQPNLKSANFPSHVSNSITTTVLIEGDVIRLLRDFFQQGNWDEYNKWVNAIQAKISSSVQFSLLDIIALDHVTTTTTIQFDHNQ